MSLSEIQREIVETSGNMIVSASAGTGKTHTMVSKIEWEISNNHTHKVIAAITFTIKASKEIRSRLSIDSRGHYIGTNNGFVVEEIIKPFAKDVYGKEYKDDMCTDYSVKKQTYQECLDYLRNKKTICAYQDSKKNFVFELALDIVKKSRACQLFLKSKYFKLYVDEYQDCDKTMHDFFMYLCNELGIELFVVGDIKQSIYIWRGAYPDAFKSILKRDNFEKRILSDNYRSCQQIQNYSNLFIENTRAFYKPDTDKSAIIFVNTTADAWGRDVIACLDSEKTCALLRFSNDNAKNGANELSGLGKEFVYIPKTPISDISTESAWLYNAIAQYFIIPKYSIYDFMDEIPDESVGDRKIRPFLKEHLSIIDEALHLEDLDEELIVKHTDMIASYLGYSTTQDHIRSMINTIMHDEYYPAFHMDDIPNVAITFHASKGLEYEQVIVFANDYTLSDETSIYNHYVAVTRAKERLIIVRLKDVNDWAGRQFCNNLTKIFGESKISPRDLMTVI